ncbi:CatB-related O-acetyltransferase [Erwinia persicina]|uniref:CatB-related O-acetyltransferase n=1 Tax=Erwinia persicina TaxID=55211 RepID=UPI0007898352|nr:CatB-related O-acetyltransferase [Erwinia persicina]
MKIILELYRLLGLAKIKSKIKNLIFNIKMRKKNIYLSLDASVKNCSFETNIAILGNAVVLNSNIGRGTYIGSGSLLKGCKIGRFCSIAPDVKIVTGNHPTSGFISTHPMFYSATNETLPLLGLDTLKKDKFANYSYADSDKKFVVINNDVWIGQNVLIMNGVSIGNGAVIAAGSVVNRNVEPYSIVGGVPAKLIKKRFSEDIIDKINGFAWWDREIDDLKMDAELFESIEEYYSKKARYLSD